MHLNAKSVLSLLLMSTVATAADQPVRNVHVGNVKQLFLDEYVIERIDGLKKVLQQAKRHTANPLVKPEHPCEGIGLQAPIVFWDEDLHRFRMYYWAHRSDGHEIYTCYATSRDGISWEKPMLGLHKGPGGNKRNNIVLRGEGPSARPRYVVRNPHSKDPAKKYLAMYIDNTPGLTEYIAYSPDGLNWSTSHKIGDLRNVTGGTPTPNPRFFLVEQKWAQSPRGRYRSIWRTESSDLKTWGGGIYVVRQQKDDSADLEFYHAVSHFLGSHTYHRLHLGYYFRFHSDPKGKKLADGTRLAGTIDTCLMVSRNTIDWHLVDRRKPLIDVGRKGAWDAGMVYGSPEVIVGDEMRFYYGAFRLEHGVEAENRAAIGLATLPLDRFVSVEPRDKEGTLTTKPFKLEGGSLQVNADAAKGTLLIEVLDETGEPVGGLTATECQPIVTNALRHNIRWAAGKPLRSLKGKMIRLRFHVRGKTKLFAFVINE